MKLNDYRDQVQGKKLEQQLIELGGVFPYPQTPNISAGVMHRSVHPLPGPNRPRLMLVVALVLLGLFIISIPPVRAAVVDFLQLGRIRIELENDQFLESVPAEPPSSNSRIKSSGTNTPGASQESPGPQNSITGFSSLGGEQTVAEARAAFPYPSPLPQYPANIGMPDRAFLQNLGGPVVIFIWEVPESENAVELSLVIMSPNTFAGKSAPQAITETTVNGARALWLEGEHHLILAAAGNLQPVNLTVEGNVLIWDTGDLTYRLEGVFALEEMVRIAESLE